VTRPRRLVGPPSLPQRPTLLEAEILTREAGRHLEYLAVADPELDREARIAFRVAQRIRGRRGGP